MTDHIDIDDEHRKLLYALNRADLSLAEYAARDAALSALVAVVRAVVRTQLAVEAADIADFWTAHREFQAALQPFRPVAPSTPGGQP
jgi:hypothetical protein